MNITIRQIRHFIAVAQELHFRRAAEIADVAQPALSRSVQTLENELGIKLLERNNRNVRLTAAGKEFLIGCTGIVEAVQSSIANAKRAEQIQLAGLRIGYTCISLYGNMPRMLDAFEKAYPSVKVELIADTDANLIEELQRESLDCCFHIGTPANHSTTNLSSAVVQHDAYSVIVHQNHPFANRSSISVDELNNQTIILAGGINGDKFKHHVQTMLLMAKVGATIKVIDQDIFGILGQITLGKGITVATHSCMCPQNLRKLSLTGTESKLPSLMTWRNNLASESAIAFRNFVLHSVQSHIPQSPISPVGSPIINDSRANLCVEPSEA